MLWNKGFCVAPSWQYFHASIRTLLYSTEINTLYLSQNTRGTRWFTSVCWSTPTMLTLSSAVWSQMENWKWILCSASQHPDVHLMFGEASRHVRTAETQNLFLPSTTAECRCANRGYMGLCLGMCVRWKRQRMYEPPPRRVILSWRAISCQ